MKIVGIEFVSYTSRRTGVLVEGYKLHCCFKKTKVQGLACETIYLKKEMAEMLQVGDEINPLYDKYGNVAMVEKIEKEN